MTEKEKMLSGLAYDANHDPGLLAARLRAKDLCHDYNALRPSDTEGRRRLLRTLLGRTGRDFEILAPFWCDYGFNIEIGEDFFANHNLVILDAAKVAFGDHVFVGPDCGFYTASHPLDAATRRAGLETARPISVGNDVWFGGGVRVCPGVTIGDGAVIAAGAVVVRDIPPRTLAVGVPARPVRPL